MDLTADEQIQLLQSEFGHVDPQCLKDVLEHYDHDYELAREFVDELFRPRSDSEGVFPPSDPSIFLQITPEMFDSLYEMFRSRYADRQAARPIREDFRIREAIYLPIQMDLAYELYRNLLQYVQNSYVQMQSVSGRDEPSNGQDEDDDPSGGRQQEDSLAEIMAMEQALRTSRQEFLSQLKNPTAKDPAVYQEWLVEKKRDFLLKHFPGVDRLKLNELFELNLSDVCETIKDIEAFYGCKLPLYYQKSLYSDIVKRPGASGGSEESRSDYGSDCSSTSSSICNRDEQEFHAEVKRMVDVRTNLYVKMDHLKRRKLKYITNGRFEVVHMYQQEITKCYEDLKTLSDDIIYAHQNHSYPNDQIDLHGLVLEEVRTILPWVLQYKHSSMKHTKCWFKIITGIGSSQIIRKWVADYILRKKLVNRPEGPGAFSVSLYANSVVKF